MTTTTKRELWLRINALETQNEVLRRNIELINQAQKNKMETVARETSNAVNTLLFYKVIEVKEK